MRFSNLAGRLPAKRNRLYAEYQKAAASGRPVLDLISTNLAEQGWLFPQERLQAILAGAARRAQIYRPDPLGLPSAREAIAGYYRTAGIRASADQVLITPRDQSFLLLLLQIVGQSRRRDSLSHSFLPFV